jgi:hypothetical protein
MGALAEMRRLRRRAFLQGSVILVPIHASAGQQEEER